MVKNIHRSTRYVTNLPMQNNSLPVATYAITHCKKYVPKVNWVLLSTNHWFESSIYAGYFFLANYMQETNIYSNYTQEITVSLKLIFFHLKNDWDTDEMLIKFSSQGLRCMCMCVCVYGGIHWNFLAHFALLKLKNLGAFICIHSLTPIL